MAETPVATKEILGAKVTTKRQRDCDFDAKFGAAASAVDVLSESASTRSTG